MSIIRELILEELKTTLETITVANGYVNEISSVQRHNVNGNNFVDVPMVLIVAGDDIPRDSPNTLTSYDFTVNLLLEINHPESNSNSTDTIINSFIGDVIKALKVDNTRGGNAIDTKMGAIRPYEYGDEITNVGVLIELNIHYRHLETDPEVSG